MRGQAVYGENLPLTVHHKRYDEQVWFTFSYSPVRDESGQVGGMFCAVMETTEQVQAQRHRADEITRLQRLFQHAPGIITVLRGPEHIFDIANDGYCRFIGRNDSVGKPVRQALPELEGQGFYELLDQVYITGKPYYPLFDDYSYNHVDTFPPIFHVKQDWSVPRFDNQLKNKGNFSWNIDACSRPIWGVKRSGFVSQRP